jgi:hypothetical protein
MANRKDYGPSVPLARLYERVSKSGNHYLTGRLGAAKLTVLKSNETTDDGVPICNVLVQEAPIAKRRNESGATEQVRELTYTAVDPDGVSDMPAGRPRARSGFDAPQLDDEIPF